MSGRNRLHGYTPLQRDLCYHIMHDGGGYKSTINTTYNIYTGGSIWGCGGNIWQGIAFGAGYGIINSLFSFLNTGSSPFVCSWGGGGVSSRSSDGAGSSRRAKPKKEKKESKLDIDNPKFADLTGKIKDLKNPTATDLQNLYDQIKKALKETDDIQKNSDEKTYNNLLGLLNRVADSNGFILQNGKFVKKPKIAATQLQDEVQDNKPQDNKCNVSLYFATNDKADDKKIEGKILSFVLAKDNQGLDEYVIDCNCDCRTDGQENKYKLRYLVTKSGYSYYVKCISTKHKYGTDENKKLYAYNGNDGKGVKYQLQCGKLVNTSGISPVMQNPPPKSKNLFTAIEYGEEPTYTKPETHTEFNPEVHRLSQDNTSIEITEKKEEKA